MNKILFLLFAIPVISMVVIALYQFFDESFKKHFVLERRAPSSTGEAGNGTPRRRYADSVPPGTLRTAQSSTSGTEGEVVAHQVSGA